MKESVYAEVDHYLCDLFSWNDPILAKTEQSIRDHKLPEHSISAVQGQFLALLANMCKAKRIVEIGTLGGYSTIWLGRTLGPNGKLTSIEIDPLAAEVARANVSAAGLSDRVHIISGNALEILSTMEEDSEPIDLFFMDADKPNYINYFNWALKRSRPGSLILADNVIRGGKLLDASSKDEKVKGVRAYCEMLAQEERASTSILQQVGIKAYDGLAISLVK